MAKSKEQKRTEALARLQDNYYRRDFPEWVRSVPGGESWNFEVRYCNDYPEAIANFIKATLQLRVKAKAANLSLSGGWDSTENWSLFQVMEHLCVKDNLIQVYRSFNANCRERDINIRVHCYAAKEDLILVLNAVKQLREHQKKATCNAI